MLRKSLILLSLFTILVITGYSQSKQEKKLEKLLSVQKYDKCEAYCNKLLKRPQNKELAYFYRIKLEEARFMQASNFKDSAKLSKTLLQQIERYEKLKDKKQYIEKYIETKDKSHELFLFVARKIYTGNRKIDSKYYFDRIAKYYQDTTIEYRAFYKKEIQENPIEIVSPNMSFFEERLNLIETAQSLEGIKYKYAGEDINGFDCSGFTKYVYLQNGIKLPHNANMQSKIGTPVTKKEALPGDLIFFGSSNSKGEFRAYHAGIILSNNNGIIDLIHCVNRGVSIDESDSPTNKYWLEKDFVIKRILGNPIPEFK